MLMVARATLVILLFLGIVLPAGIASAQGLPFTGTPIDTRLLAPAPSDAPFLDASDEAWPVRVPPASDAAAKGVVRVWDVPAIDLRPFRARNSLDRSLDEQDAKALLGEQAARARNEGPGAVQVHRATRRGVADALQSPGATDASLVLRYVSGQRGLSGGDEIVLERTVFAYYAPEIYDERGALLDSTDPDAAPKAIVLIMPGLFGSPDTLIEDLISRLRAAGYGVLRLLAQPSRFTENFEVTLDLSTPSGCAAGARLLADTFQGRAAECAYAVRATFGELAKLRPETAGKKRGVIGMSAGAITLPTTVALEPEAFHAAVLIAGGVDFWQTNYFSNYRDGIGTMRVNWVDVPKGASEPAAEAMHKLRDVYLASAPLDGFHAARSLKGKPVLVMHANLDAAVPAALGELMWERLGRPERWASNVGHEAIFVNMALQLDMLVSWMDRSLGFAPAEDAASE
ncbi:MAG: hypothetical protein SFZ23_06835 [Planctomycetota bacterium]|nr:hypothetical protein [Planctomycetota bacterium]